MRTRMCSVDYPKPVLNEITRARRGGNLFRKIFIVGFFLFIKTKILKQDNCVRRRLLDGLHHFVTDAVIDKRYRMIEQFS